MIRDEPKGFATNFENYLSNHISHQITTMDREECLCREHRWIALDQAYKVQEAHRNNLGLWMNKAKLYSEEPPADLNDDDLPVYLPPDIVTSIWRVMRVCTHTGGNLWIHPVDLPMTEDFSVLESTYWVEGIWSPQSPEHW